MTPPSANDLGAYLRARRDVVLPEQAGINPGPNRRVPGLRREEVALLAGISGDYYLRLERGRDAHPSPQVLQALARVLLLDDVETQHLFSLAAPRTSPRRRQDIERVPQRLRDLLAEVSLPTFIEGRFMDVLDANPLATALSPRLRAGQNRLRSMLLDPEEQNFQQGWEHSVADLVGAFRHNIGDDLTHPRAVELVGELSLASARFTALWTRHDIAVLRGSGLTVHHPVVGTMQLHRDKFPVEGVYVVMYYAAAGSDASDKLSLLASMAVTR